MRLRARRKSREEARRQMAVEQELERRRRDRPRRRSAPRLRLPGLPRLRRPALPRPQRPGPPRRPSPAPERAGPDRVAVGARAALDDVLGILREVFAWPVRVWLAVAEFAGELVLAAWVSGVLPLLKAAWRGARAALRFGEREVTPVRGLAVVALAATIGLGASQFTDYRAVEVGAEQYSTVRDVASAPQVAQETPRSAHGVSVFVIAVASLFALAFALGRNWRLARLLAVAGLAVVLISLLADVPQGLREGAAAISYEGANAVLLGAFWVQLFCGVTLMIVGPMLASQLRREREVRRRAGAPDRKLGERVAPGAGMKEAAT